MSIKLEHHHEGCLFSAMSSLEEMALIKSTDFFIADLCFMLITGYFLLYFADCYCEVVIRYWKKLAKILCGLAFFSSC